MDEQAVIDGFSYAVQNHLDAMAQERRYDSILSAISYRDSENAQYAAEAAALHKWRSDVWTYATAELDKALSGERAIPTPEAFIAELPAFEWPDASDPR